MKTKCCVPFCLSEREHNPLLKFYKIPNDNKKKRQWVKLIRSKVLEKKNVKWKRVCSLHFDGGRKTYDENSPKIFPWNPEWEETVVKYNDDVNDWYNGQKQQDHEYAKKPTLAVLKPELKHHEKQVSKRQTKNSRKDEEIRGQRSCEELNIQSKEIEEQTREELTCNPEDPENIQSPDENQEQTCDDQVTSSNPVGPNNVHSADQGSDQTKAYYEETYLLYKDELQNILSSIEQWLEGAQESDFNQLKDMFLVVLKLLKTTKELYDTALKVHDMGRFLLRRFEGSDEDIRFWTGIYSYKVFKVFWTHYIEPNSMEIQYWSCKYRDDDLSNRSGPQRKLEPIDELFMTLIKLKQGSANEDLAERFGVHKSTVSRIVITWIKILHVILSSINIWISKAKTRQTMPKCFKGLYQDVRVIVDCTEIRSERPSDFDVQCATYSTYKSCNTYKALVGISPSGIPTFISELYEGCISDNEITNKCQLRDMLDSGDAVMADRGWTCANWLSKKGIRLITPHFLQGRQQLTIPELVESVSIARVRIHVERCMGRIKQWHFLKREIPLTYWNMISDIFQVCGRLLLLWPPLIEED